MSMSGLSFYRDDVIKSVYVDKMNHRWPSHNHPGVYQIVLVFEGKLEINFSDGRIVLGPDEFIVISPQKVHSEHAIEPIKVLALSVNQSAMLADSAKALDILDGIIEALLKSGLIEVHHIITLSKAASQLITLHRSQTDECSEFVVKARKILEKWPEKSISTEEMAQVVATCRGHLNRVFKKQIGLTPHQYQIQNRVRKASLMLVDTD